jgi:putative ABC transport system substrate-binding protein
MIRFWIFDFGFSIIGYKALSTVKAGNRQRTIGRSNKGRLSAILLCTLLLTICGATHAQQQKNNPRIGILLSGSRNPIWGEAFRNALRELGYIEGKNIRVEYRNAGGDSRRQIQLAKELVALQSDILIASGGNDVTQALTSATKTIPIVMTAGSNPVGRGIITSLARPGGNVTGITSSWDDLSGKRLELLKETIAGLSRVGVLWNSTGGRQTQWKASQAAAKELNLHLHSMQIHSGDDMDNAFKDAIKVRIGAVAVTQSSEVASNIQRVIELTTKHRLPAIYATPEYGEAGGLMVYGSSRTELARRAAIYVDKILKGAKPAELPVEQPTKFELVINLKTANQLGLKIPPNVLARANRVIR